MTKEELKHMLETYHKNSKKKPYLLISKHALKELIQEDPDIQRFCNIVKHPMCVNAEAYLIDAEEIEFYWDVRQLTTGNKKASEEVIR